MYFWLLEPLMDIDYRVATPRYSFGLQYLIVKFVLLVFVKRTQNQQKEAGFGPVFFKKSYEAVRFELSFKKSFWL